MLGEQQTKQHVAQSFKCGEEKSNKQTIAQKFSMWGGKHKTKHVISGPGGNIGSGPGGNRRSVPTYSLIYLLISVFLNIFYQIYPDFYYILA